MLAGVWTIRGYGYWAVELKETGELIGRVGAWFPIWYPEIEVGWLIARELWGRGFASEAGVRPCARFRQARRRPRRRASSTRTTSHRDAWPRSWAGSIEKTFMFRATRNWSSTGTPRRRNDW